MPDYSEWKIRIDPFDPWSDILTQWLADEGFESFDKQEPFLLAYIPEDKINEDLLSNLRRRIDGEFQIEVDQNIVKSENWNEKWESNFPEVVLNDRLRIRAPFHEERSDFELDLLVSPKMAFGTGHHPTTSLMLLEILNLELEGTRVLDVGTGTGILAVLCEKRGSKEILAIDFDEWSVENAIENSAINNCRRIIVEKATINDVKSTSYNVILANINRNVIQQDLGTYAHKLAEGGHLLLSGFLNEDIDAMKAQSAELGMSIVNTETSGDWSMLHVVKSPVS